MNKNAVNVAVVDGKTITESVELRTTKQGDPVRIKAVKDGKYIIAEAGEKTVAPENLTIKRVGNDLHVATEGTDPDQPQLIIEGFYEHPGQLVGVAEDGAYYEYISSDAEDDHAAAFLADGVSSPQVLGSEELVGFGEGLVAGNGIGWFWPALLGLGALGLLGAAYKLTRDDDNNDNKDGGSAIAPSAPTLSDVTDDVGDVQGPINKGDSTDDRTPTFSGEGTPGNTIIIEDNGKPIGEVVVGDDGKWEFTPTTPLPEGEHSIIVVEKDKDGNTSGPSDEFDFIIDITAPGKSIIDAISDDEGDQQGVIAPNGLTDDKTPTLTGTAEPGATLEIYANDEKIGETTVEADGSWTFTPSPALEDGEYSFTTIAIDAAGNAGLPSDPYIVTIDTTAPVKPGIGTGGIEEAIDNVGPIIGDIGNGGVTDDGTPTFGGGGLQPGDKVTIIDDGVEIGEVIVGEDGRWEFTPDPELIEGPHPITVIVTDPAGNKSEPSDPYIVIVDTTAPVKPGIGTGGIEEAIDNVGPIIGDIGNGGVTDDGTPTFGGGGLQPGDKVTIIDDGVEIGEVIVDEDGRWEFTPDPELIEGPHPITVIVTDPAGNASEPSDPYIVIVDTTAPVKPGIGTGGIEEAIDNVGPIIGDIGNGGVTDDGTPTFGGGGLQPGDKVTIIDGSVEIGEVIVGEDGRWEFTPDPELIEGPHPITVIVTDPAGNASEPSDPYIVIVDTTAPVAPTIDSVFDDQGTSTGNIMPGDITDDSQPEIRGQAEPGTTVIIYDNGREIGRVPVAADGSWTHTPVPPLLNGPHDLTAEAVDADGNTSAPSNSVDFELVAGGLPPAPSITGVFDDIADNVGNIMPGESTNDTEPQVSGTAEAFSTVTLFANGVPVGSVVADALGNWTITPSPALTPGLNNLTATATNSAGNVSPATGDYPITVDITPPAAADASQLEDNVGAITGPINSGDITDDNTPTFSGTAEPNTTLIIYDGGVEIDRVPVDGAGNWSYTPARPLADGSHSFSTEVVDAAGNRSPESTPIDFTVDTSAVAISIEQALDNVGPNQDPLASGSVTDDTTPTLRGQATPGSTVNIYLDGVLLQEGVAVNNAGRWEYEVNPQLPEGSYAFTATVVTAAGGESAPTADFNLEIDLTPPAAPTIDEIRDDVGDIQDPLVDGSTTDDTTPTLVGSGVAGDTIIIRNNGNELDRVTVQPDGSWTYTPNPALNNGSTNQFDVIAEDPAGNQSAPSDPWTIIIDTAAPVAPTIDSVFDDQGTSTGNIMPGDITDDSQPEIRGQAEPGTTVIIYDNGREIGRVPVGADGSWTHTPVPPLLNGPHDLTAEAVDAAGNTSAPSNSVDFELIAGGLPPAPSITGVFDDIADNVGNIMPGESTNDTEPQVSGTAEAFSTVTLFANGVPVGSVVADALGNWTITPSPALTPGLNNLTATATNSAGNVSPATGDYPITVDITPPAAADASQLEDNVGAITGPINSGDITDDNTPTFSGTAEPNTTLIIYDGGVEIDRVPVDGAGNWSYTPARPLADGSHSFSTEVVDAAGNRSPESTPIDFTVDTSAVAISIEQALDNVGPNQDPLASGSVTDDATPTLRGQATPGSTVNIYLDGVLLQEGVAVNNAGRWEYEVNPPLPEGSYAFTATVVTAAGGESAPTADFNLEIDLTPPAAPTIDEIRDDVGDIQDPLVDGSTTDDTTPTLVGSGVAGDTIIIRNNGNELDRVTVQPDGSWTYTPNPALNNGSTNVFDVIAQDPAGNQSAPSAPWTVIIDTTAPITQITSVINDDGTPTPINPGDETTDRTPLISGTSEPGSTVTIFDSGVPIDTVQVDEFGNWSYSVVTPLSSGSHGLTASSVDLAGNQGPVSDQFDLRITSVFGTYSNIESFDGAPLGGIAVGSVLDLKAMAITNISGSSDVVPVNPNTISDPMLRIYGKLDFDLKGDSSSVLVMEASGLGAQHINEIRFYDANGVLIHTDTVSKEPGSQQFIMPGGMEFSRFEIETDVNAGSGLFVDNLILANGPIKTEGFEGLPLNHKFDLGVPFELDLFTLTRIENNVPRGAGVGLINQGHAAGQQLAILGAKVEFDLKGETASTLNFKLTLQAGRVLDTIITFYNADGELIHTEIMLGGSDGLRHISMPDGLEFSSFVIDNPDSRHLYINEISFADLALPNLPLADESNTTSDHVIYVTEGDEAALVAEGSDAIDTLVLTGANQLLDLSALGNQVSSIEVIDLTGTGDNTLNLSLSDVLSQGGDSLFTADDTTQMMIKGNAGDVVNLDDLLADGTDPGDWAGQGQVIVEGVTYNVFQHSSLDAQLLVQDGVTTNLV
ncbi:Ig-like domain-containing protein [Pseudomonas sp. FP818]|uniref:Ig-like domain-containing protein n=1 Tax=Pseudomonas sp. FP818 TaxID=2954099 RepID=UPI002735ACA9|nr:Ig-like domain-containing protein [Pseudomonas sp. FP818]WLI37199.1 Ig-like domain-containing protein [Pseudomonas sp. FP818]